MTEQQRNHLISKLRDTAQRASITEESARRQLIDEGIYTQDGSLRPEFGGKGFETERTISFL
ncbi:MULTISPECIES: hypothetical protein [Brucella]|uniref:Uncharacterized protein n=1 Tax=Brucella haematophila TaxID=419474 RepID=A0ABX1DR37_9HYPH|nr:MULTISPECIES: hypothetical protein [Brucella]NKC04083.1 hypothetical protein [Brucella haematophila]TMV05862.1 hypothetical protein FGI60_00600 [Brucella haematophila]